MSPPSLLRLVCLGATVLAALVVLGAWVDFLEVFSSMDTAKTAQAVEQQAPLLSKLYGQEAQHFAAALASSLEARHAGLREMRGLRMLVLFALSMAATSLCMSGWRLLFMERFSKLRMARMLSKTALACAILRTLDGAQSAALARRAGAAFDFAVAFNMPLPQGMETSLRFLSVALSFCVVALFFFLWRFFQAPKTLALLGVPPPPSPPSG